MLYTNKLEHLSIFSIDKHFDQGALSINVKSD